MWGAIAMAAAQVGSALLNRNKSSAQEPDASGLASSLQGSQLPSGDPAQGYVSGSQAKALIRNTANDMLGDIAQKTSGGVGSAISGSITNALFNRNKAAQQGKDTRAYLQNAFPNLNQWEQAGAGGSMAGSANEGFDNAKQLAQMQNDTAKEIAKMNNDATIKVAGIQSQTSRQNTADQVFAQNEMLRFNQVESGARIVKIRQDTQLSEAQRNVAISQEVVNRAQAMNINLTASQIKAATEKINAETNYIRGAQTNATNAAAS